MSLTNHHPFAPSRPATLAEAVARARFPRNRATVQLEPHREELLRLRAAGDSVESLVGGLRLIGVEIGCETLRRWLQREQGRKPGRRRTRRLASGNSAAPAATLTVSTTPSAPIAPSGEVPSSPRAPSLAAGEQPTPLVLPGESPGEALRRRIADRRQREAASTAEPSAGADSIVASHSMPPS